MDKKVLKERLDEAVKKIKQNSKDINLADRLIDDLLMINSEMSVEPLAFDSGKILKTFKGNSYEIILSDKGAIYHEYGGYAIFVQGNYKALFDSIVAMGEHLEDKKEELLVDEMAIALRFPLLVFSDINLFYDSINMIFDFLSKKQKEASSELSDETVLEDMQFKEASLTLEKIKEEISDNNSQSSDK